MELHNNIILKEVCLSFLNITFILLKTSYFFCIFFNLDFDISSNNINEGGDTLDRVTEDLLAK